MACESFRKTYYGVVRPPQATMITLYRHLLREILATTLIAIGILTFVLVLGNIFTRLFDLIVNHDVPHWFIWEFILMLIPFSLVFTLPWGLLTAIMIVFGRMSADSELVAIRASGISLSSLIAPVLLLAVLASGVCFVMNSYLAPFAMDRIKSMVYNLAREAPGALFDDDTVIDQFPDKRIYVARKEGNVVYNLHVWDLDDRKRPIRSFRASKGEITPDEANNAITLKLHDARMEQRNEGKPFELSMIGLGRRFDEFPLRISLSELMEKANRAKSDSALPLSHLIGRISRGREKPADYVWSGTLTEIQKRVAASFSCITFTLIGIPLAIRSHRRETSIGVALSFGVVFAYYFLIMVAETYKSTPGAFPELIIWAPNVVFQLLGLLALVRVSRS